jgi:hypothetical protein
VVERTTYPPGVPCWIDTAEPDLDAGAAVADAGGTVTDRA